MKRKLNLKLKKISILDSVEQNNIVGGSEVGPECGPGSHVYTCDLGDGNTGGGNTGGGNTGGGNTGGGNNDPTDPSLEPGGGGTVMGTTAFGGCPPPNPV